MFSRKNPILSITAPPALNTTWCIPSSPLLHTSRALWISFPQFASSVDDVLSALFATILQSYHSPNWGVANSSMAFIYAAHFSWSTESLFSHPLDSAVKPSETLSVCWEIQLGQNSSTLSFEVRLRAFKERGRYTEATAPLLHLSVCL